MKKLITPTLALCLAGGLAAGIALSRPADAPAIAQQPEPVLAEPSIVPAGSLARSEPIEIVDFTYTNITVSPGAVVEVRNLDGVPHTVTAANGEFDTDLIDGASAATFVAPATPGVYAFFCTVHPAMSGTLTVT